MSQNSENDTRPLIHNMHSEITLAPGESSQAKIYHNLRHKTNLNLRNINTFMQTMFLTDD